MGASSYGEMIGCQINKSCIVYIYMNNLSIMNLCSSLSYGLHGLNDKQYICDGLMELYSDIFDDKLNESEFIAKLNNGTFTDNELHEIHESLYEFMECNCYFICCWFGKKYEPDLFLHECYEVIKNNIIEDYADYPEYTELTHDYIMYNAKRSFCYKVGVYYWHGLTLDTLEKMQ